jgi:hypothetical protein
MVVAALEEAHNFDSEMGATACEKKMGGAP